MQFSTLVITMMSALATTAQSAVIAFDIDLTVWNWRDGSCIYNIINILNQAANEGNTIKFVTARNPDEHSKTISNFNQCGLSQYIDEVAYTSHQNKVPFLEAINASKFYDDDERNINDIRYAWSQNKLSNMVLYKIVNGNAILIEPNQGGVDRCGCPPGKGWSTTKNRCATGSVTEDWENCNNGPDRCGCLSGSGWSSREGKCVAGSVTDDWENCQNRRRSIIKNRKRRNDRCGCPSGQGWSTTQGKCMSGSVTEDWENCSNNGIGKDRCGCPTGQGWSTSQGKCAAGSVTEDWENCPSNGNDGDGNTQPFNCNPHAPCPEALRNGEHGNGACLIKDNGNVYLNIMTSYAGKHNEDKYDLPGGTNDKPGGESQACVAWRETCEEGGFAVNVGRNLNGYVFECTVVSGTNKNPTTSTPYEVKGGRWLTYDQAKNAGRQAYRDNGNSWGAWDLIQGL